ncbi:unnamed protein product [Nesidiocoris tenuis]|uniref:Ig-like domain-containing protein n=1 Tax=Nesidiocoris tenuis TaxID=355587 RepID=A0A6H5GXH3_9HEMI|nr:unnamed protein product [Nesidiocoris tenuis]
MTTPSEFTELYRIPSMFDSRLCIPCPATLLTLVKRVGHCRRKRMHTLETPKIGQELRIRRLYEPRIIEGPHDVKVDFGGLARFTCRVDGEPKPQITWMLNRYLYRILEF